jgi:hypothetical protein
MTIAVTGDTLLEIRSKLSLNPHTESAIRIRFIRSDFSRIPERGCIVDATDFPSEARVPRQFETPSAALKYIGGLLRKHDALVKEEKKKIAKAEKEQTKK